MAKDKRGVYNEKINTTKQCIWISYVRESISTSHQLGFYFPQIRYKIARVSSKWIAYYLFGAISCCLKMYGNDLIFFFSVLEISKCFVKYHESIGHFRAKLDKQLDVFGVCQFFQRVDWLFQFWHGEEREQSSSIAISQYDAHQTPDTN